MAETHLQINPDASITERKTTLWPSSKDAQREIIRNIFSQNSWTVQSIENVNGSHWKIISSCQDNELKINLFISSIRDESRQPDEFKMQLGSTYPVNDEVGWITTVLGIYIIDDGNSPQEYILSGYDIQNYDFSGNPSIRGTRTSGLQKAKIFGFYSTEKSYLFRPDFLYYYITNIENLKSTNATQKYIILPQGNIKYLYYNYLTAIRTKPFLLLAGISGTGKSRIVRELAFKSCPKYLQDKEGVSPGNYCMIEVKPNWHDSTELLGYYSNLSNGYQFKKFVKFLVKAKMNPEVPFFVCLDEMNLAPVEQYFAEILSILETRKHPKDPETGSVNMETIKTEVVVENKYFKERTWKDKDGAIHEKVNMTDKDWYEYFFDVETMTEEEKQQVLKYEHSRTLQEEGLTLPDNVVIIGTVNMDDTTHQFSRKVIDRAMTIEMNGGNLRDMFGGSKNLEYIKDEEEQQKWQHAFLQRYVTADEVLEAHPEYAEEIIEKLPERLESINMALKGTPFEVSYRVLNELTIMVGVMLDNNEEEAELGDIINQAINNILLMKILPRIEGDAEMFSLSNDYKKRMGVNFDNRLEWLKDLAPKFQEAPEEPTPENGEDDTEEVSENERKEHLQSAEEKIQEMIDRLNNQDFTRFWP